LRFYPRIRRDEVRFRLFEAGPRILREVDAKLAATAARVLQRRGVDIQVSTAVRSIEAGRVRLASAAAAESIDARTMPDLRGHTLRRALALLAPFGIFDEAQPGLDIYALPSAERMSHLFAKGVPDPFVERFAELGPDEGPVARYLSDVAAASLLWPLGDRGNARRIHRIACPTLVLWGELDELLPVATSAAWAEHGLPVEVVAGAGHLLEWDEPDGVAGRLVEFLADFHGGA